MPCDHRFINDLLPEWPINYLFVGTFNPEWDNPNGNNANWFYGRRTNDFWYIMPQVFGYDNLMNRQFRNNPEFLRTWCENNSIGVTDLITTIADADENNPQHVNWILGMQDNDLENFEEIIPTNISQIIEHNRAQLRGVYLTRYAHTLNPDGTLSQCWNNVINTCDELGIEFSSLITPSRGYRALTRDEKLNEWQQIINL